MKNYIHKNKDEIIYTAGLVVLGGICLSIIILVAYFGNGNFSPDLVINY